MTAEQSLANFVVNTKLDAVPSDVQNVAKRVLLTVLGTAIAGARESGVSEALKVYGDALPRDGGATVLVHGDTLPFSNAAAVNGLMCRALDYCDAMAPGLHFGSSLVPAALASAELVGGCSGREFLEALVVGAEVASRLNLSEAAYGGLDPTGVAGIFASTAAAARILHLGPDQTLHALALAFNRCGGSFQSNIDGSLAVRMIQGWVAADGVTCARLAQAGITGPVQFLSGVYGYAKLYAKEPTFPSRVQAGLGSDYQLLNTMFKKYPSCGLTQGVTELSLQLLQDAQLDPAEIEAITVRLPPYAHRLVGHDFVAGENPRVNAQFSAQYCVANALIRRGSTLDHFVPERVMDPALADLIRRVAVEPSPEMDERDHTAVDLEVRDRNGRTHRASLDFAPGFPKNPLSEQDHIKRFEACLDYAKVPWPPSRRSRLLEAALSIQDLDDARELIELCTDDC